MNYKDLDDDLSEIHGLLNELALALRDQATGVRGFDRFRHGRIIAHVWRAKQHVEQAAEAMHGPLKVPRRMDHV